LGHWLGPAVTVRRAAPGSHAFFAQTARALVDLVGLDSGLVLLRQGAAWQVRASTGRQGDGLDRPFSNTILRHVVEEKRTFYQTADIDLNSPSLQEIEPV